MGYRSEVAIAMKSKDFDKLKNRIKEYNREDVTDLIEYADQIDHLENKDVVVIRWNWVKWDEGYEDVAFIMDFLNDLDENCKPYKFVRVGEEAGDIETLDCYGENGDDYSVDIIGYYSGIDYCYDD